MTKLRNLVLLGALLVPQTVFAQDRFGSAGQFALSADRLTGISHTSIKREDAEPETQSMTTITLLANPLGDRTSAYSFPRLGGDYFVIDGLSLGVAIGLVHSSTSREVERGNDSIETDGPSSTGFLFYPRVGYALMFQDNFGFWPRGGLTYASASSKQEADDEDDEDSKVSESALALSLEALFVFAPVPHVAFTGGPTLDLGLSGSYENDPGVGPTDEYDIKATDIGLQLGVTAFF